MIDCCNCLHGRDQFVPEPTTHYPLLSSSATECSVQHIAYPLLYFSNIFTVHLCDCSDFYFQVCIKQKCVLMFSAANTLFDAITAGNVGRRKQPVATNQRPHLLEFLNSYNYSAVEQVQYKFSTYNTGEFVLLFTFVFFLTIQCY